MDKFKYGELQFYDHKFRIGSVEGFALPIDIVALFQEILFEENESLGKEVIYLSSYEGFKEILNRIPKSEVKNMKYINKLINNLGLGEFFFTRIDKRDKVILVKNLNNPLAERSKTVMGLQNKCVDFYILGILVAVCELLLEEKELKGKELYCKAQGKPFCLFEIRK